MKKIIKLFTVLSLIMIAFSSVSNSDSDSDSVFGDTMHAKDVFMEYETRKELLLEYFSGIGAGIGWTNVFLKNTQNKDVYCPPNSLLLSAEDLYEIYKEEYYSNKGHYDSFDHHPPAFLTIIGLTKKFPCP